MTRGEILAMKPGPELNALVAEKVMGWIALPYPTKEDPLGNIWLHEQEGIKGLPWTGYISNSIYGFCGNLQDLLEDGSLIVATDVPGKVWEPSINWGAAGQVVEVMQKPPYSYECYLSSQSWGWDCTFSNPGDKGGAVHGDNPETPMTVPEAISKAALLAVLEATQ